jgi:hypothetical protein
VVDDATNTLYVVDTNNHRIQRFSPGGTFISKWRSHGTGEGQFYAPEATTVSADGERIYVSEVYNHRVQLFAYNPTGIADARPPAFVDLSAYPNPFNPVTTIELSLDRESPVSLCIYDIEGRLIRTLFDGDMASGPHVQHWDGRDESGVDVSSGVYVIRVVTGEAERTLKLAVVR